MRSPGRRKILVVDDDGYTRKFFELLSRRASFVVVACGEGAEAVSTMDAEVFDLYFIDAHLPPDFMSAVLNRLPSSDGVFFMTGLWEELPQGLRSGELRYRVLEKPFDLNELKKLIG